MRLEIMNCQHCGSDLNVTELDVQQGATVSCPRCDKPIRVKYTMRDEFADPVSSLLLRDTKYAHPAIVVLGLVVAGPIMVMIAIFMLSQNDIPEGKLIGLLVLVGLAWTVIQFVKRMSKQKQDIEPKVRQVSPEAAPSEAPDEPPA